MTPQFSTDLGSPAPAGNTLFRKPGRFRRWDHPAPAGNTRKGTRENKHGITLRLRETLVQARSAGPMRDHPHAGTLVGNNLPTVLRSPLLAGNTKLSSPSGFLEDHLACETRFSISLHLTDHPAPAGNTPSGRLFELFAQDHPAPAGNTKGYFRNAAVWKDHPAPAGNTFMIYKYPFQL